MRIVLDTSVLVAGFRSRLGASNQILQRVAKGTIRPLVTTALFLEYEDVLLRAEHRLVSGMSEDDVRAALAAIASAAEAVEVHFRWRPQLADPSDELVLEAAVNGRADAIVTFNGGHFKGAPGRFGIKLWKPAEALREIRK